MSYKHRLQSHSVLIIDPIRCHFELFGSCLLAAALWPKECGQPCPHAFLYFSVCTFMTWARLLGFSTNDPECSLWARPCKVYSYPLVVMHILNVRSTEGTSSHCLNYWPCSVSGVFAGRLLEVGWFPWVTAMSERVQWDGLSWFTCLSWFTAPHTGAILQLTLYRLCLFSMTMMLHWSSENSDHCVYLKKPGWFQHCILRPHYMCGPTMYSIYIIYILHTYTHNSHKTRQLEQVGRRHICHSGRHASQSLGWWPGFCTGSGHLPACAA